MGLLDQFLGNADQTQALGLLGAAMMQGNMPGGFTAAQGLLAEAPRRRMADEAARMQLERGRLEMDRLRREEANERGLSELSKRYFTPGVAGQGGTAAVNDALPPEFRIGAQPTIPGRGPQFDVRGFTGEAVRSGLMDPIKALQLQKALQGEAQINKLDAKDFTPESVQKFAQTGNYGDLVRLDKLHFADTGGTVTGLNPFTGKPVGGVPKTGNPYSDLLVSNGQGGLVPNMPLIGAKSAIAAAGAARNKVDVHNIAETEWSKKRAGSFAELMDNINKTAFSAPSQLRKLERMEQLLAGVDGGKLAPTGMEIASYLNSVGVKIDPRLGNKEAAESLSRELAGQLRQPGTGPMTDKDFENFLTQVPSLSKSAEGRKQITATMRAAIARDMEVARRAREYNKRNGKIDDNFLDEVSQYIAENPVIQVPKGWQVTR